MIRLRFILVGLAAMMHLVACASHKPALNQPPSLAKINRSLPAEENLRNLAAAELAADGKANQHRDRANAAQTTVAIPPGIEPEVLALRDPSDPRHFMTLEQAIQDIVAQMEPVASVEEPAPEIDPEAHVEALKLYARGRSASLAGRQYQAVTDLQKAMELDPHSPQIVRELARSYLELRNSTKAMEMYERLVRLDPTHAEALFTLGLSAANRRDFRSAVWSLGRLRVMGESFTHDSAADILADFTLAISLRELGYDRASIQAARQALNFPDELSASTQHGARLGSVYRQRGELWRGIGDAHCRLGEFADALEAYSAAASLPTADPTALYPRVIYTNLALGRIFNAQYELFAAIRRGSQGLRESPIRTATEADASGETRRTGPVGITDREVRLCAYLAQHAQPVELLAQAVETLYRQQPDDSGHVRAAASLSSPERAQELLREFLNRNPRDLAAASQLLTWLGQQDVKSAVALTIALAHDHPDLANAYVSRLAAALPRPLDALKVMSELEPSPARARVEARLLSRLGGLGEAWSVCSDALQRWPDDRGLLLQRVQIAAELQEPALLDEALATLTAVESTADRIALAQALMTANRLKQAIDVLHSAMSIDPENPEVLVEAARAEAINAEQMMRSSPASASARAAVDQAVRLAELAIAHDQRNEAAYELLAQLYAPSGLLPDANQFRSVLNRLRKAVPTSALTTRLAAQEAISQHRYEQGLEQLLALYDSDPSDRASLTLAVTAWHAAGRLETVAQWIDQRLAARPGDPALLEQWLRVQLLMNRSERAIDRLQQMVETDDQDLYARQLLETVYQITGQIDSMRPLTERRLNARPEGVRRALELAKLYVAAELADRSLEQIQWLRDRVQMLGMDELRSTIAVLQRLRGVDRQRDRIILELVEHTIDHDHAGNAPLAVYAAGLQAMANLNMVDERFDTLIHRAIAEAPGAAGSEISDLVAWRDLAQGLLNEEHPVAAARALRARLNAAAPLSPPATAVLAWMTILCDAASDAAVMRGGVVAGAQPSANTTAATIALLKRMHRESLLNVALGLPEPVSLTEGLYYASLYYAILEADVGAERLLREVLEHDPNHAMAMNNLGYMRLEAGQRDAQTIEWIERAHALAPDDPNILDTIGWLRYKQGRLTDEQPPEDTDGQQPAAGALSLIKEALARSSEPSPVVHDHLGDIFWRLGDQEAATIQWRKAAELLESPEYHETHMRVYVAVQTFLQLSQPWHLVVADPQALYDRQHGALLWRVREKLVAAEQNQQPEIEPTFAEQ